MLQPPFGLGFVGVNQRARRVVLPGLLASPDCRIVAICSRDHTKAAEVAASLPEARPFVDFEAMLQDSEVDAVFLNLPNDLHYAFTMRSIAAGKHVIAEKPLAENVDQALQMTSAARHAGVRTAVNFTLRSMPGPRTVSRMVGEGVIGKILTFELTTLQSRGFAPSHGANALADLAPHLVDLLAWWSADAGGGDVEAVAATATELHEDGPHDAAYSRANVAAHATLRLQSGASGTLNVIRVAQGFGMGYRAWLYGDKASLVMAYDTDSVRIQVGQGVGTMVRDGFRDVQVPDDLAVTYTDFPKLHFGRIAAAIASRGAFPDFADGVRTQRVLDAITLAGRTEAWVRL